MDMFCFGESLFRVVEEFARQVVKEESDIQGEEAVQKAAKFLQLTLDKINLQRLPMAWDLSRGFSPAQTIPAHIIHPMWKNSKDPSNMKLETASSLTIVEELVWKVLYHECGHAAGNEL